MERSEVGGDEGFGRVGVCRPVRGVGEGARAGDVAVTT